MQVVSFEVIIENHNFPLVVCISTGSTACLATFAMKCMHLSVEEHVQNEFMLSTKKAVGMAYLRLATGWTVGASNPDGARFCLSV